MEAESEAREMDTKPGKYVINHDFPPMENEANEPVKYIRKQRSMIQRLLSHRKNDRKKVIQNIEKVHSAPNLSNSHDSQNLIDPAIFPDAGGEEMLLMDLLSQRSERNLQKLRNLFYALREEKSRIGRLEKLYHDELDQNKIIAASTIRLDRSLRHLKILIREIEAEKLEQKRVLKHCREAMIVKDSLLVGTLRKEQVAVEKLTTVIARYRAIEQSRWLYMQEVFRIAGKSRSYNGVDLYNVIHHIYHTFETSKPKRFRRSSRSAGFHVFPDELYKGTVKERYPSFFLLCEKASQQQAPLSKYVEGKDLSTFRSRVIENQRIIIRQNNLLLKNRLDAKNLEDLNPSYLTKTDVLDYIEGVYFGGESTSAKNELEELRAKVDGELNKHFQEEKVEVTIFRHIKGLSKALRATLGEVRSELSSGDFLKDIKLDYIYEYFAKTSSDWEARMDAQKRNYEVRIYEDIRDARDSVKKKYGVKIKQLKEKLENVKKSDKSKQQIRILQERIANSEGKIKSFFLKSEELRKELESTNKQLRVVKNENVELSEELEETKLVIEQEQSSKGMVVNDLQSKISELEIEMDVKGREMCSEKKKLESQLNEKTDRIFLLVGEQKQSLQKIEKLSADIVEYRSRLGLKDDDPDLDSLLKMDEILKNQEEKQAKEAEEKRKKRSIRHKYQQTVMNLEELTRIVSENTQNKQILMLQNQDGVSDQVEIIRAQTQERQIEVEERQKRLEEERKKLKEKVLDLTTKLNSPLKPKNEAAIHLNFAQQIQQQQKAASQIRLLESRNKELQEFITVQTNRASKYRAQKDVLRREYDAKVTKLRSTVYTLRKKIEMSVQNRKVVQKVGTGNMGSQTDFSSTRANIFQFLQMMREGKKIEETNRARTTPTTVSIGSNGRFNKKNKKKRRDSRELMDKLQNFSTDELSSSDTNKIVKYMLKKYEEIKRKKNKMNKYSYENYNKNNKKKNKIPPLLSKKNSIRTFEDFRENEKLSSTEEQQQQAKKRQTLPHIFEFDGLDHNFEKIRRRKSVNRNKLKKLMILSDPNRLRKSEMMLKKFKKNNRR